MVMTGGNTGMWEWEKSFYSFLIRNARPAKDYYNITPRRSSRSGCPCSSSRRLPPPGRGRRTAPGF
jgi:hypothetical protein